MKKVAVLIDTTLSLGNDIVRGIVQYANVQGPWLFFQEYRINKSKSEQHKLRQRLELWRPDGIIIREERIHSNILTMKVPMIVSSHVQTPLENAANLIADDFEIGSMGGRYFRRKAFQNFAFCGYSGLSWSRSRFDGFARAVSKTADQVYLFENSLHQCEKNYGAQITKLGNWLRCLPKPLALMACSDDPGIDVTEACKQFNLLVPNMIAVLGVHNDSIICDTSYPPMSSIALNGKEAGYKSAKLLDAMMSSPDTAHQKEVYITPTEVIIRRSTDIMAIDDEDIRHAVEFLYQHRNRIIQVGDVADHVGISLRTLQRKFRQIIGHALHQEITLNRIEFISNALVQSDMSISEIARSLGYNDICNFSRYFKKAKGLNPRDFRIASGVRRQRIDS